MSKKLTKREKEQRQADYREKKTEARSAPTPKNQREDSGQGADRNASEVTRD
jgi:hypothetical protein